MQSLLGQVFLSISDSSVSHRSTGFTFTALGPSGWGRTPSSWWTCTTRSAGNKTSTSWETSSGSIRRRSCRKCYPRRKKLRVTLWIFWISFVVKKLIKFKVHVMLLNIKLHKPLEKRAPFLTKQCRHVNIEDNYLSLFVPSIRGFEFWKTTICSLFHV